MYWVPTRGIAIGAQNCSEHEAGAYTGEVSAPMLKSAGIPYVILGHDERRQYFGENGALLAKKVDVALKHGLTPHFLLWRAPGGTRGKWP